MVETQILVKEKFPFHGKWSTEQNVAGGRPVMKLSAVFFDRDGTVIFDRHYLKDPAGVTLIPGVADALRLLADHRIDAFLVSNQSGIGRGYFTVDDVVACQSRLNELLQLQGTGFKDARFCPHAPEERCTCRKPSIGMWKSLSEKYALEPAHCAMIGDKEEDLAFGRNSGMACSVLVLTGKGMKTAAQLGLKVEALSSKLTPFDQVCRANEDPVSGKYYVAHNALDAVEGLLAMHGSTL